MLQTDTQQHIRSEIEAAATELDRVREEVAKGRWRTADPSVDRRTRFFARRTLKTTARGAEAVQGPSVDFQECAFLPEGAEIRRAVGFVEVNDSRYSTQGSGFLISPRLFITNQHVIQDATAAQATSVTFEREFDRNRRPLATTNFVLAPDVFAEFSPQEELDFAVVAVGSRVNGPATLAELGFCPISDRGDKHVIGMSVNIIQHPNGWPKMITIRNNILLYRTDDALLYDTDTEVGSSGSPVFNDEWDVVALHHYGEPFRALRAPPPPEIPKEVNEGIRISAIYRELQRRLPALTGARRDFLREALALADQTETALGVGGRVLSPPRPAVRSAESNTRYPNGDTAMSVNTADEVRVIVPIEVTVRIGAPCTAAGARVLAAAPVGALPSLTLRSAAEAKKLDRDYTNRNGFDATFIPGLRIPLPELSAALRSDLAPLRATEEHADEGLLKYQNFSVKLSRSKRLAFFTVTNIQGDAYLAVDRDTGRVVEGAEGETWYKDPRTSETFYLGQDFYSAWSHYFDRGHLTRRTDPTWGTATEAERANADTFHFSNCSPQHFRFNQTAKYWQGVERYVLENGVLAADPGKPICVLQGPIFDDQIDYWCDDVQIPSSFWKVVVWKGANSPKAVGLIVDQGPLMSETRVNLGKPRDVPSVDVSHWRVPIARIEKKTGLDFGAAVRNADTIQLPQQPQPGAEAAAAFKVADWSDLLAERRP
jgi:endonuclease G